MRFLNNNNSSRDEVQAEAAGGPMEPQTEEDINAMADRITAELDVDRQIVLAALGATATGEDEQRRVDEALARELILAERDAIRGVTEDCDEVCCFHVCFYISFCALFSM